MSGNANAARLASAGPGPAWSRMAPPAPAASDRPLRHWEARTETGWLWSPGRGIRGADRRPLQPPGPVGTRRRREPPPPPLTPPSFWRKSGRQPSCRTWWEQSDRHPSGHKPKGVAHVCSRCPLKHLFHLQALACPAPYLEASVLRHRDDDVSLPRAKLRCSHGALVPLQLSECRLTLGVREGRSVSVCSGH